MINDSPAGNTRGAGRCRFGRGSGANSFRGRPGRVPDRDRLWARRRRQQRAGRGAPLPSQRPAGVQSAHCPCPRSASGASAGALYCRRGTACRSVLAGAADARSSPGRRMPGGRARDRRPRYHCLARPQPQGGARNPQCIRQTRGGAIGQLFRPRVADDGGACPRRFGRPHRSHRRWRRYPGRRRVHDRRLPR